MPHTPAATYIVPHGQRGIARRVHPRKGLRVRVDCSAQSGRTWRGMSRDLSQGGMFLEYTPGLSVGDTISLAFILPTGRPCRLDAQVVRTEPIGAGLRFVEPNDAARRSQAWRDLATYCEA